jgi:cell division protease FtsH
LLAELDGFLKMDNVIVVAATNRAQDLDEALMRPGRFDRKIFVGNPDILGREAILAVHGAKMRLGPDADLEFTAKRTPGLSGAAMANIVNESALQAAERDAEEIAQKDLQRAVDKETFGDQRNLFLDEKTKRRVAEHEAGHALAQYFAMMKRGVEGAKVDNKITIIPHGKAALGYAEKAQKGEADTYLQTQDELEADIVGAMGGRAAEETIYPGKKGVSTGPGSDIADHADRMARAMIEQLGMSPEVGIINAGPDPRDPMGRSRLSDQTKFKVDQEIKRMTGEALAEAKGYIAQHRDRFDALVKALFEKETLYQEEIAEILGGGKTGAPQPR